MLSLQSHPPPLGAPQSSSAQGPLNPKSGPEPVIKLKPKMIMLCDMIRRKADFPPIFGFLVHD